MGVGVSEDFDDDDLVDELVLFTALTGRDDPVRQELGCRCYVTTRRCCPLSRGDENALTKRMASLSANSSTALENEVRRGILSFPNVASRFYLHAPAGCFDLQTDHLCADASRFFELVTPWQTGASMGLPEDQGSGLLWVMHSGTMMAHVMVEMPPVP